MPLLKDESMRRGILLLLIAGVFGITALSLLVRERTARCAPIPLLADNLLPNASLARSNGSASLPDGWEAAAPGVVLRGPAVDGEGFDLDRDGRAIQLIGIGNHLQTPSLPVEPGKRYCFSGRALTDSEKRSTTRIRVVFEWLDQQSNPVVTATSDWQPVVLWEPDTPPTDWSMLLASATAPQQATTLRVRLEPASDDRIYLDAMALRQGGLSDTAFPPAIVQRVVELNPWPYGAQAALSFSFDWETAMGGLIHSRSVDDPRADQDPLVRAMRMREGVTTTLAIFRPYGIRATYYANGYNFLPGNPERRLFMGNPTFAWARQEKPYQWRTAAWATTPWFASDPYGTVQSDPGWYFADLVRLLLNEGQDIQSHTFSHFHGGFASPQEWQADLNEWRVVAGEQGLAPARSLAFPWSGSGGMSDASWDELEAAGITSITRTNWSQRQYRIVGTDDLHCRPVPGHESILACPDFSLTAQRAPEAIQLIERAIAVGGMIDLWAHTEEVATPEGIAAWQQVVAYAAQQRDAGALWIAPLAEIADWQQALAYVSATSEELQGADGATRLRLTLTNTSSHDLEGLTVRIPFAVAQATIDGVQAASNGNTIIITLRAGATTTVVVQSK